jgi:hypothetical protein
MAAAWETGWYWLGAGQSGTYWVSWGDTWQGLQFIAAEPRASSMNRMDVIGQGIRTIPQFGVPPKVSYWVTVVNRGPDAANFVLRGTRVAD